VWVLLQPFWIRLTILFLAIIVDAILGEPPAEIHPTVWMGKYIAKAKNLALKSKNKEIRKVLGAGLAVTTILLFSVPAYLLEMLVLNLGGITAYLVFAAVALKTTFAIRCMHQFNMNLHSAIEDGRLEDARRQLTFLVRRDPWKLDLRHMISASVETIAEGIVDGAVSPLFYFSLLGLPGAVAYRAINTLDSMVGYKNQTYREVGFFSAKLDTAANYVPARVTAFFLILSALIRGEDSKGSLRILKRDHSKTESLNAGWPMSAMAGALGIELVKKGYYRLGDSKEKVTAKHIMRALGMHRTAILLFSITIGLPSIYLASNLMGGTGV